MRRRPYRLGRRQAAVDRTRARIVRAAEALISRGAADFSIEAVARRARVTRVTVYQRFGSRARLLEALFDDLAARGGMGELAAAFRSPDPDEGLARFVATFAGFWTAHRSVHRRLAALGSLDPALGRTLRARQEWRRRGLAVLVGRLAQRHGRPAPGALDEAVDLLFALTSFEVFDALAGPSRSPADVAPVVLGFARSALGLGRG